MEKKTIISPVGNINEKLICMKTERPEVKKFIVPAKDSTGSDEVLFRYSLLSDVTEEVFDKFRDQIETKVRENESLKKVTLDIVESQLVDGENINVFCFNHPLSLNDDDIKKFPAFFTNISSELINRSEGIVLDGLIPSFLSPMLIASQQVANHISNFIAVRSGSSFPPQAFVIRTNNDNTSRLKVGDHFAYELPENNPEPDIYPESI